VCRALKAHLEAFGFGQGGARGGQESARAKEAAARVEGAMEASMLPALTLIKANPAVVNEVWASLGLLHYTARFRLYGAWKEALGSPTAPLLAAATKVTQVSVPEYIHTICSESRQMFPQSRRVFSKSRQMFPE
jgi:hypothetical protein